MLLKIFSTFFNKNTTFENYYYKIFNNDFFLKKKSYIMKMSLI